MKGADPAIGSVSTADTSGSESNVSSSEASEESEASKECVYVLQEAGSDTSDDDNISLAGFKQLE